MVADALLRLFDETLVDLELAPPVHVVELPDIGRGSIRIVYEALGGRQVEHLSKRVAGISRILQQTPHAENGRLKADGGLLLLVNQQAQLQYFTWFDVESPVSPLADQRQTEPALRG